MHRGRGYPQILDRQLSPDCTVPFFAPVKMKIFTDLTVGGVNVWPGTLTTHDASTNYGDLSINWYNSFTNIVTYDVNFKQKIDVNAPLMIWSLRVSVTPLLVYEQIWFVNRPGWQWANWSPIPYASQGVFLAPGYSSTGIVGVGPKPYY